MAINLAYIASRDDLYLMTDTGRCSLQISLGLDIYAHFKKEGYA